jgi:glycosyltransferase involved in cell wall biosynthesis
MRIAVNTRFLLSHKMEGYGWYTFEIVKRLVENHPEHEFIFFFDRKFDPKFIFGKNVTPVVLNPPARHPILFYIWNEIAVTRALKKYKADIYFSPDGYLSLKTKVKQVNVIHDINFEHNPQDVPSAIRKYLCKYFPKFAKKAHHIITVSDYSKQDICKSYTIPKEKVTAILNAASTVFKPVDEQQRSAIQTNYSNGKPYFLFVGALHPRKNLSRLVPAFEQFKKQNPNDEHQLLIVGEALFSNSFDAITISEELKHNIHFTGHLSLEELSLVMASASVFTFVPYFEGFGIPMVEAMQSGTPVLAGNLTSLPEVGGDAVLYCDPMNIEDIAAKLSLIANNEQLKAELTKKGLERSLLFSWDKSAEKVWELLMNV